ncbi:neurturin [Scleropages formosus]|uniref:neurturin n=1 Tax=Scleropages formosus TaxID=113540 RepID=UPI000878A987|nr:neurturin-like [Scleropages formosus]
MSQKLQVLSDGDESSGRYNCEARPCREAGRTKASIKLPAGPPNHLRNFKVMLWMLACVLTLAEGAIPGAGRELDPRLNLDAAGRQPPPTPEVEGREVRRDVHSSWGALLANLPHSDRADLHRGRLARSPSGSTPLKSSRKNRKKSKGSRDCRMERKEMRVRDLGLGFDSDEIVLFKYCAGTCRSSRLNYDLALKTLMDNRTISKQAAKKVSAHPCCRPTRYETVSFMDAQTTWRTIESLSAASCSCVG